VLNILKTLCFNISKAITQGEYRYFHLATTPGQRPLLIQAKNPKLLEKFNASHLPLILAINNFEKFVCLISQIGT